MSIEALIARRHRQLLVHSFIYYVLGESIIADSHFDEMRRQLAGLHTDHPDKAKAAPYYSICKEFKTSPSGFFIKEYPPEIRSVALRVLWQHEGAPGEYGAWLGRRGFKLTTGDNRPTKER